MGELFKSFNGQDGRFNRFRFWIYTLVMLIIVVLFGVIVGAIGAYMNIELLIQISSLISSLGILYVYFTSYIKRLHDLDKSGWMSLLIFVPFANIYLLVICGFFKGTTGDNKYGKDLLGLENGKETLGDEL